MGILEENPHNIHTHRVVYRRKEEFLEAPSTNAVHIAVFVTSHARRRLFARITEAVERGLDLLYCDSKFNFRFCFSSFFCLFS